ncbi:hypothetical protein J008_04179 [Cryptococcus neoformans]|nr:hypothetical protein C362_05102 [Cryptococcus neoformans var. grubii Bt1]OXG22313.1 hypothetical protein C367_04125 [Cryptococcus neoformans var. grubii Ze90-1]OXH29945.1 hypothetical protein J008_04179 [Cryptococcus neoformans var. grubii]
MPRTRSQTALLKKTAASLDRLPIELQTKIITHLKDMDPKSLLFLARVSKSLYYQCIDHIYYEVKLKRSNRKQFFRGLNSGRFLREGEFKHWYKKLHQQPLFGQSMILRRLLLLDKVHRVIIADGPALEKTFDIAINVAMEHSFVSYPLYQDIEPQALFRNLGQGKKGLPCMIWKEDAMDYFDSLIQDSYLEDWEYAELHDESLSEESNNLARERLDRLYNFNLYQSGTPFCLHLPDSWSHDSQTFLDGIFKGNAPKTLALHNVKLLDWSFGKSSGYHTPDEMHLFLLAQGLPKDTYERPPPHREALGEFLSNFSPEDAHCKIHIYNYARKGTESEEDVKRKVLKICRREYARKKEFSLLCGSKEAREEPSDGCPFRGKLVIHFEKAVCKFCGYH